MNEIICGECSKVMAGFGDNSIDLTVTSPPYDNLRDYEGYTFNFEPIAEQLYRVTKEGGVVVWVVGDATIDGSETGTSFRQALGFMDMGFRLHDTMIYHKQFYVPLTHKRYEQEFEYMFIFGKGKPKTFNPIKVKTVNGGKKSTFTHRKTGKEPVKGTGYGKKRKYKRIKGNVFTYQPHRGSDHPAVFPEKLARDHILSWSNPGDLVLDPFVGSGTVPKMCVETDRNYIGIDINEEYCELARRRVKVAQPPLFT